MKAIITIKVETTETEERVFGHLDKWIKENFQKWKDAKYEVCGKNKLIKNDKNI